MPLVTPSVRRALGRRTLDALAVLPVLAVVLWLAAVAHTEVDRMDDTGLVSVLPRSYLVALGLPLAGFVIELGRSRSRGWVLGLDVAAIVLLLHGTIPLLYDEPRYTYAYKHIAVTRYVLANGGVSRPIEIYQNWAGFPGAMAYASSVTGIDPMTFANWSQLLFAALDVLAVRFVATAFTTDARVVATTSLVYVIGDWVGQNYFAPQALAYVLCLVAVGLVLHCFAARDAWPTRVVGAVVARLPRLRARGVRRIAPSIDAELAVPSPHRVPLPIAAGAVVGVTAAVIVTHPLSPFILAGWFVVLVLLGRGRLWWLPVLTVVGTVAWSVAAHGWLSSHVNVFADVGSAATNASGTAGPVTGSPGHELITRAARLLSLTLWSLAGIGFWRRYRSGRIELTLAALVGTPFVLVVVQSYGGEAIYRVYLFTMPWCALLVAHALLGRTRPVSRRRAAAIFVAIATLTSSFLFAYFGLERTNHVTTDEVAASTWFERNAPPGSILAVVAGSFPLEVTENYDRYRTPWGTWGAGLIGAEPSLTHRELGPADVPSALDALRRYGAPETYIVLSPGQEAWAEAFGDAPPGAVDRFADALRASPDVTLAYRNTTVTILQLRPVGAGP